MGVRFLSPAHGSCRHGSVNADGLRAKTHDDTLPYCTSSPDHHFHPHPLFPVAVSTRPPDDAPDPPPAAAAQRRPTKDPNIFRIPTEQLPPGFADALDASRGEIAAPRPAATVVLLREGNGGPEVLLLRRHHRSGFAAGAWVFPGGAVDDGDRDPALPVLCDGRNPLEWAERLGISDPDEAFAYIAAALREAFEETGILLARAGTGGDMRYNAEACRAAAAEHREAVLAEEISMREIAARHGLRYVLEDVVYIAHWITPEPEPRRFDTRFFLAPLPDEQECEAHQPELVEAKWLSPALAVEGWERGEFSMLPPTVHTLRRLRGFDGVTELIDALRDQPVPSFLPRIRRRGDGVVIEVV